MTRLVASEVEASNHGSSQNWTKSSLGNSDTVVGPASAGEVEAAVDFVVPDGVGKPDFEKKQRLGQEAQA